MSEILITGATAVAAVTTPDEARKKLPANIEVREFDFKNIKTYGEALRGISKVFLMLPPGLGDLQNTIFPFIAACRIKRVEQIVLLSLQGAENAAYLPHRQIEKEIERNYIPYTFLRPSYFNQNFLTTHRDEVKNENRIFIPAGTGKTSFVDTRDIAEVAYLAFNSDAHLNQAYELTGREALSYYDVAQIFTEVLGKLVRYTNPSLPEFVWESWQQQKNLTFVMVMAGIYTSAKLGRAANVTGDLAKLLGREPVSFRRFVQDYADVWK
jgi:uncharacterized protein YbjT (DUF2867 family)